MTTAQLLLAVLIAAVATVPWQPRRAEAVYQAASMEYGASVFVFGHPTTTDRDFQMMSEAGLSWARMSLPWRSVEPSCKDCYEWSDLDRVVAAARAWGIRIIARLDRPPAWTRSIAADNGPPDNADDYGDFVASLVGRYGSGGIPVLEIWNEPNLSREWGGAVINKQQAAQYTYLLKVAYRAAKAVDPNITVLSAGLSPTATADGSAQPDDVYLQWLYDEGLRRFSDGVGLIGNSFGLPPEVGVLSQPGSHGHAFMYFRHVAQMRQIMVANGDEGKQVWLLEFGYTSDPVNPSYAWHAVDEDTKAEYIVRALQYAKQNWYPWIAVMSIWCFADPEWDASREQYWWAITEPDGTPRPAYNAIASARASGALP